MRSKFIAFAVLVTVVHNAHGTFPAGSGSYSDINMFDDFKDVGMRTVENCCHYILDMLETVVNNSNSGSGKSAMQQRRNDAKNFFQLMIAETNINVDASIQAITKCFTNEGHKISLYTRPTYNADRRMIELLWRIFGMMYKGNSMVDKIDASSKLMQKHGMPFVEMPYKVLERISDFPVAMRERVQDDAHQTSGCVVNILRIFDDMARRVTSVSTSSSNSVLAYIRTSGVPFCGNFTQTQQILYNCLRSIYAGYKAMETDMENGGETTTATSLQDTTCTYETLTSDTSGSSRTEPAGPTTKGDETTTEEVQTTTEEAGTTTEEAETTTEEAETTTEEAETTTEEAETTTEEAEMTTEEAEMTTEEVQTTTESPFEDCVTEENETTTSAAPTEGNETTTEDADCRSEENGTTTDGTETTTEKTEMPTEEVQTTTESLSEDCVSEENETTTSAAPTEGNETTTEDADCRSEENGTTTDGTETTTEETEMTTEEVQTTTESLSEDCVTEENETTTSAAPTEGNETTTEDADCRSEENGTTTDGTETTTEETEMTTEEVQTTTEETETTTEEVQTTTEETETTTEETETTTEETETTTEETETTTEETETTTEGEMTTTENPSEGCNGTLVEMEMGREKCGALSRTHDSSYSLYRLGERLSQGARQYVETGRGDGLDAGGESPNTLHSFVGPPVPQGEGASIGRAFLDSNHTLVSVMARINPSPDWFIGVDSFQLCVEGNWVDTVTVELDPLDGGTDNGFTFTAANWPTQPQGVAYRITSRYPAHPAGSFYYPNLPRLPPLATLTFTKLREYTLTEKYHEDDVEMEFVSNDNLLNSQSSSSRVIDPNHDLNEAIAEERREMDAQRYRYWTTDNNVNGNNNHQLVTDLPRDNKEAILHSIAATYIQRGRPPTPTPMSWPPRSESSLSKTSKGIQTAGISSWPYYHTMYQQQQKNTNNNNNNNNNSYQRNSISDDRKRNTTLVVRPWGNFTAPDHLHRLKVKHHRVSSKGKHPRNRVPRDCKVGEWGAWSACSRSCGVGETQRTRKVTVKPRRGGSPCPPLKETKWCGSASPCSPPNGDNGKSAAGVVDIYHW